MMKKQNCVIWIQKNMVYIKTDIYKDIAEDVENRRFDTSNYELDHCVKKKI